MSTKTAVVTWYVWTTWSWWSLIAICWCAWEWWTWCIPKWWTTVITWWLTTWSRVLLLLRLIYRSVRLLSLSIKSLIIRAIWRRIGVISSCIAKATIPVILLWSTPSTAILIYVLVRSGTICYDRRVTACTETACVIAVIISVSPATIGVVFCRKGTIIIVAVCITIINPISIVVVIPCLLYTSPSPRD